MKLINLVTAANLARKLHATINVHNNTYFYNVVPDTANISKTIYARSTHATQLICSAEIGKNSNLYVSTADNASAAHFLGAVCAVSTLIDYTPAHALLEHAEQTHCWIRMQDEPHIVALPVHATTVESRQNTSFNISAANNAVGYQPFLRTNHRQIDYNLVACYTVWQWLCRHPDAHVKQQLGPLLTAATLTGVHA